jgi:hypothetical protein
LYLKAVPDPHLTAAAWKRWATEDRSFRRTMIVPVVPKG